MRSVRPGSCLTGSQTNGLRFIIQVLANGTKRYAKLQREIGGISQKMLTQTLRSLERDGLVQRKVHPVVPPKVEYSLTRLGRTLIEPLHGLCRWSEKHLAEFRQTEAGKGEHTQSIRRIGALDVGRLWCAGLSSSYCTG